jgi:tetratricopeptide (TPR) repeat protein
MQRDVSISSGKRPVLVIGMHRSGTSAIARIMNLAGWRLPADLVKANGFNPRGYWEAKSIVNLNDEILESANHHWADPAPLPDDWLETPGMSGRLTTAKDLLAEEFGSLDRVILKDPRISLTLPFWRKVFGDEGHEPLCLIACRHPAEVVASLQRRDAARPDHGALLWLRYMTEAERNSRGLPRAIVHYDSLLSDWRHTLETAIGETGLGEWATTKDQVESIRDFLDPGLRHHEAGRIDTVADCDELGWAIELYDHFRRAAPAVPELDDAFTKRLSGYWQDAPNTGLQSDFLQHFAGRHLEKGRGLLEQGFEDYAWEEACKAVELAPGHGPSLLLLGQLMMQRDMPEEAARTIEKALESGADEVQCAHFLRILEENFESPERVIGHARRILELGTENCWVYFGAAQSARRHGQLDMALDALEEAIRIDCSRSQFHWVRICVLESLNRMEEAREAAETAMQLAPDPCFLTKLRNLGQPVS